MQGRMPPQKHIVDGGVITNQSVSQTSMLLAKGVINPDPYTTSTDCRAGSIIGDITLQLDVSLDTAAFSAANFPVYFDWFVFFNINDSQTPPTADDPMASAGKDLIQQIFHEDGTLIQGTTAVPTANPNVFSWRTKIGVPQAWRKLNRGDTIRLYYKFNNANVKFFLKIRLIYKEYYP